MAGYFIFLFYVLCIIVYPWKVCIMGISLFSLKILYFLQHKFFIYSTYFFSLSPWWMTTLQLLNSLKMFQAAQRKIRFTNSRTVDVLIADVTKNSTASKTSKFTGTMNLSNRAFPSHDISYDTWKQFYLNN